MALIKYRADIDGLRAIAVLAVIAFHLPGHMLPHGYLGVDIFFVISGYLITQIIWAETAVGKFTIRGFYDRRLRRIMPALLLVLAGSTVVAIAILLPADLIGFAKSLVATLVFSANIYFWRDTYYFSRAAEEKPLLHLWSLGVEEQFYLAFPLVLVLVSRRRSLALPLTMALAIGSFAINIVLNRVGGQNPAFFLLPPRAWELLVGATIALLHERVGPIHRWVPIVGLLGFLLVCTSLLWGNLLPLASMPTAVSAVVGASLLIWGGRQAHGGFVICHFLASRVMVLLGKISYSLYLWHWPVLVFSQYYLVRALTPREAVLALFVMLCLAIISYRWVEQPFRNRDWGHIRTFAFTVFGSSVAAFVGALLITVDGWPGRLPAEAGSINRAVGTNYRCPVWTYVQFGSSRACPLSGKSVESSTLVLFGNSHAQMYAPMVERVAAKQSMSTLLVPMNGCLPTTSVNLSVECAKMAAANLEEILRLPSLQVVVVGTTWSHAQLVGRGGEEVLADAKMNAFVEAVIELVVRIEATGRAVVLIGPIPTPGIDLASMTSRNIAFGWAVRAEASVGRGEFEQEFASVIAPLRKRLGAGWVEAHQAICPVDVCHYIHAGRSVFADSNHIAVAELDLFAPLLEASLCAVRRGRGKHANPLSSCAVDGADARLGR